MRRLARNLWQSFRDRVTARPGPRASRRKAPRRLELETLERREVPATGTLGTLTAFAFVDVNHNGIFDPGESPLPYLPATLTGKTSAGVNVSQTFTSDNTGGVSFYELQAGTYQVSFGHVPGYSGSGVASGLHLVPGQNGVVRIGFQGLASTAINLNMFTTTATTATPRFTPPTLTNAITATPLTATNSSQVIDLAGHFASPLTTNSLVRMDTSSGPMLIELFDSQAPQTVANFFNYVNRAAYNNSIFHRLVTASSGQGFAVLQGGGFTFSPPKALTATAASESGTKVTMTLKSTTGLFVGDQVTIAGFTPAGYNGTFTLTGVTATQITYTATASGLAKATVVGTAQKLVTLPPIPTDPAIANEFKIANTNGTIAMARGSGLNSATDEFYFNLKDNSSSFNAGNPFVVFGTILGPADQTVLTNLATTPTVTDESKGNTSSPFQTLPMFGGYPANSPQFPGNTTKSNFETVNGTAVGNHSSFLTYAVLSNSNPSAVSATVVSERLILNRVGSGTATITVLATDRLGQQATTTFTVTAT